MALCGIIKHHNKNEKPCVLGFWHFLTSERIAGFSASLSAQSDAIALSFSRLHRFFIVVHDFELLQYHLPFYIIHY